MRLQEMCKTCVSLVGFVLFHFIANGRTALENKQSKAKKFFTKAQAVASMPKAYSEQRTDY